MKNFGLFAFGFLTLSLLSSPIMAEIKAKETATPQQEAKKAEPADILGFRSAYFGMTMEQVKIAIEKDFNLKGDADVRMGQNMVTRTESLSITVNDLLPDTGKAFVSYIFGYESKGLIQVNIVWNSAEDPKQSAETILGIGGSLQSYFVSQNFDKDKIATGIQTSEDSLILVRAIDKDGNAVVVLLNGIKPEEKEPSKDLLLHMSYQADPINPDIYKIPEGKF